MDRSWHLEGVWLYIEIRGYLWFALIIYHESMNLHLILILFMSPILLGLGLASCACGKFRLNIQHSSVNYTISYDWYLVLIYFKRTEIWRFFIFIAFLSFYSIFKSRLWSGILLFSTFSFSWSYLSLIGSDWLFFLAYLHLLHKDMKFGLGKSFCQSIGNHLWYWYVLQVNLSKGHLIMNIVMLDVYVFCASVEDWVMGQDKWFLIVTLERKKSESCWSSIISRKRCQICIASQNIDYLFLLLCNVGFD